MWSASIIFSMSGDGRHMAADYDSGLRRKAAHDAAHLANFADVDDD